MENNTNNQQPVYRTGDMYPPKKHRGIIAFLLIAVIFLSGVVSGLGYMNIRLFQKLQAAENQSPLQFIEEQTHSTEETLPNNTLTLSPLGLTGWLLTDFDSHYYNLPRGIYITDVADKASANGIQVGDILLEINGKQISDQKTLEDCLSACQPGNTVTLSLFRNNKQQQVRFTLK